MRTADSLIKYLEKALLIIFIMTFTVGQSNILQAVNLTRFPQHECAGIYDDNLQKSHRYVA